MSPGNRYSLNGSKRRRLENRNGVSSDRSRSPALRPVAPVRYILLCLAPQVLQGETIRKRITLIQNIFREASDPRATAYRGYCGFVRADASLSKETPGESGP